VTVVLEVPSVADASYRCEVLLLRSFDRAAYMASGEA